MHFGSGAASAEFVPEHDQRDRDSEDQGGDGVDFGSDAATEAGPDFEREGVVTANEEESDGNFVHRESKDEQARGDQGKLQIGEGDAPEGLPGRCAEIERGFLLGAIEFLQAGKEFGGGDGDQGSGMTQEDCEG